MSIEGHTAGIFGRDRADWNADPHSAFDAWLAGQGFRSSSADVYRAQWGLFLEWLVVKKATLQTVERAAIEQFVAQLDARRPQRVRYLRLIERVLDHVRAIELAPTNPARFIAQDGESPWRSAPENEPTGFLADDERAALVSYLLSPVNQTSPGLRWREYRDRALTGAFLGGGIKTGEATALSIDDFAWDQPWLVIQTDESPITRETKLSSFAVTLFNLWVSERRTAGLRGGLMFPAAPSGRPMHKATMLRAIDAIVEAAGISDSRAARASPQTLRNTYAASLFQEDADPERVGQWLGFQQVVSAHRLYRAWQTWKGEDIREQSVQALP
jgi:site-specific recombinase XerD